MEYIKDSLSSAVITLGGQGKRISNITRDIPKPLWEINGVSTIERITHLLNQQGINKFIWLVGYKPEFFFNAANELKKKFAIEIIINLEESPLGEAGGLLRVYKYLEENFLFINGDIVFDIDLKRFFNFHIYNKCDISFITHLTSHPEDSDCIAETQTSSIYKYKLKKEKVSNTIFYLGNAGVSIVAKKIIKLLMQKYNFNLELSFFKDIIVSSYKEGMRVRSYNTSEYLKDMGTPSRLKEVESDLKNMLDKKNSYRNKQKVLFIDRDNTIIKCEEGQYILDFQDVKFFEDRIIKIAYLSKNFNSVIMVSNQPQISMGLIGYQEVININAEIILKCQKLGLNISSFYICPHHPHSGFKNEISFLKTKCFCRKPMPGLFLQASFERNISLSDSLMIGDSWRDQEVSMNSNMKFQWAKNLDFPPKP